MKNLVLLFALASGWALAADVPGVQNFHQVDDHLYRGAQPTAEGIQNLARMGIKTDIDFTEPGEHKFDEQAAAVAAGVNYIHLALNGAHAPSSQKIAEILSVIDREPGPVFVHCRRGADRTGTVVACYRIARQNWPNAKALIEANHFGMGFTEFTMRTFIMHFRAAMAQPTPLASIQK